MKSWRWRDDFLLLGSEFSVLIDDFLAAVKIHRKNAITSFRIHSTIRSCSA